MAMASSSNLYAAKRRAVFCDIPQRSAISRMEWAERGRPPPCLRRGLIAISKIPGEEPVAKKKDQPGRRGTLQNITISVIVTTYLSASMHQHWVSRKNHKHYFYYTVRSRMGSIYGTFVYVTL